MRQRTRVTAGRSDAKSAPLEGQAHRTESMAEAEAGAAEDEAPTQQRDVTADSEDEANAGTGAEAAADVTEAHSAPTATEAASEGNEQGSQPPDHGQGVSTRRQAQGAPPPEMQTDHQQAVLQQLGSDDEDDEEEEPRQSRARSASAFQSKRKRGEPDDDFLNDAGVSSRDRKEARRQGQLGDLPQAEEGEPERDDGDDEELNGGAATAGTGSMKKGAGRRGRGKKNKKSEEELRMEVENLVAQMQVAVDKDAKAAKAGKPALMRMHLLKQVAETLRQNDLQMLLVDPSLGVLDAIKRWLSPLEGWRLPNEKIVSELLDCLNRLPIDLDDGQVKEQLKRTGLGKMVGFYAKLPNQKQEISRLAAAVENKWTRQLYRLEERYRPDREEAEPQALEQSRRRSLTMSGPGEGGDTKEKQEEEEDPNKARYKYIARQPKEASMDYARRPAPDLPPERLQAKRAHAAQIKSVKPIQKLKQRNAHQGDDANVTAVEVSVQGTK